MRAGQRDRTGEPAVADLLILAVPDPYGNPMIRSDGLAAFVGWPTSPRIEALRAAWLDAENIDEQQRICIELQMQLWRDVPYIPMGEYCQSQRRNFVGQSQIGDLQIAVKLESEFPRTHLAAFAPASALNTLGPHLKTTGATPQDAVRLSDARGPPKIVSCAAALTSANRSAHTNRV